MKKILLAIVMALTGHLLMADALQDALNNQTLVFTTGGSANWFVQAGMSHDGVQAAQSGHIGANQSTWLETTVTGPVLLSFWWRTSSEGCCDRIQYSIGSNSGCSLSGNSSWQNQAISIPSGEQTVRWTYSKDGSVDSGSDCAWLDEIMVLTLENVLGGGLSYSIDDGWSLATSSSHGPYVVFYGNMAANANLVISTSVNGPGTLRFRTHGNIWEDNSEFGLKVDSNIEFLKRCEDGNQRYWRDSVVEIPVLTKGSHDVAWYVRNSSTNTIYCDVGVSNVEWIPASANVVIEFDGVGGTINGENTLVKSFATGEQYGALPTPVKNARTFKGWFTADGQQVSETGYVIPMATNLYACWSIHLDGVSGEVVTGKYGFYESDEGIVFPEVKDCWDYPEDADTNNFMSVKCEGPATVSFEWVITRNFGEEDYYDEYFCVSSLRAFEVDGEVIHAGSESGYGLEYVFGDIDYVTTLDWYRSGWANSSVERVRVKTFLTPGVHELKWSVPYQYSDGGDSSIRYSIDNFKVEPVGTQETVEDWASLLVEFMIWKPDDLVHLRDDVYGARIAANPDDYEARIVRAAIKLALLAEDREIRDFIRDCGITIADYTMKATGRFCGLERLAPGNDIVDRLSPVVLAAIDDALADLNAIPENWNGSLELSPKKYSALNEAVYVDMAEISVLKAAVEAARASVLIVKGYDFTMDYVTVSNAAMNAESVADVLNQAPQAWRIRDANALIEAKSWFKQSLQHIRRADQIILWRSNPLPHFFEYDIVDADNLARSRLYLEQLIGSLDHPETIDLPYFVDKFGYDGETLPCGMFRQLYLGAIFAGRITQDIVPEIRIERLKIKRSFAELYMDSVDDTTLGGLLPDFGFEEFAELYPFSQRWSLTMYGLYCPASRLFKGQTLTVEDVSTCAGTLEYVTDLREINYATAQCLVNGLPVDTISVGKQTGALESRSVAIPENSDYSLRLVVDDDHHMRARRQIFDITSIPEVSPVADGSYSQNINGVTWNFTVSDDEATVTGVSGVTSGDLSIPEKLGGRIVTGIGDGAFSKCGFTTIKLPATIKRIGSDAFYKSTSLTTIRITGDEPTVGEDAFYKVTASVVFMGGTALSNLSEGKWYGMSVQYASDFTNEDLRVCASLPDGYEFNGMATLSLSVSGGATIYFTMNGAEPTTNALVYSSPISVSITTRIKYFAVDNQTGDTGPVGSVLLKLVTPDSALLYNSEYSKTVNGIGWSYQESVNGVRLTGNSGTAAGDKVSGAISIPDAINWQPVTVVGASLFASCDSVTSIKIPSTVTEIERDAFRGCTRLESITLPDGLMSIADGAFERCTSLTNIVIPASVTNIGYFAFRDCLRLAGVVLKGKPPRQDLGVYMGVPAFTVISGRMGSATAIVYAGITNKFDEITVPESWLEEIAVSHDKPAGADSYQAAFKAKYGDDLKTALTKPTGKYDLKGNPLYVWQDYVAGTDPLDEEDRFTATITMEDGVPVIRWSPELPDAVAATRKYTVYGAKAIDGKWDDVTDRTDRQRHDDGYQFFSVTVELNQ